MSDFEQEEWRPVPGLPGVEASSLGRIRQGGEIRADRHHSVGYRAIDIRDPSGRRGRRTYKVHRLVALTFHGAPKPGHQVAHQNGVKTDNRPENLRWASPRSNCDDRRRHGTNGVKLTVSEACAIVAAARAGERMADIAARFGIGQPRVSAIARGEHWAEAGGHPGLARRRRCSKLNYDIIDAAILAAGGNGNIIAIARAIGCSHSTISQRRQALEAFARHRGLDLWALPRAEALALAAELRGETEEGEAA